MSVTRNLPKTAISSFQAKNGKLRREGEMKEGEEEDEVEEEEEEEEPGG